MISPPVTPSLSCCSSDALSEETVWTSTGRYHVRCYIQTAIRAGLLIPDDDSHVHAWSLGTNRHHNTCACGAHRCIRRACSAVMLPNRDGLCVYHWELSERCRVAAEEREIVGNAQTTATLGHGGRPTWGRR